MRSKWPHVLSTFAMLLWLAQPVRAQQSRARSGAVGSGLTTLEGRVRSIQESSGEGGLQTLEITLETASGRRQLLLAPRGVLQQMEIRIKEEIDRGNIKRFGEFSTASLRPALAKPEELERLDKLVRLHANIRKRLSQANAALNHQRNTAFKEQR